MYALIYRMLHPEPPVVDLLYRLCTKIEVLVRSTPFNKKVTHHVLAHVDYQQLVQQTSVYSTAISISHLPVVQSVGLFERRTQSCLFSLLLGGVPQASYLGRELADTR